MNLTQPCQYEHLVDAYHDGELPADRRGEFERHLAACATCIQELRTVRAISRQLAAAPLAELPAASLARLRRDAAARATERGEERAVLRIASLLTGVAAAVLVVGSVGLFQAGSARAGAPAADWERAAVTLQWEDPAAADVPDPTQLDDWTADEDFVP